VIASPTLKEANEQDQARSQACIKLSCPQERIKQTNSSGVILGDIRHSEYFCNFKVILLWWLLKKKSTNIPGCYFKSLELDCPTHAEE
jgi:hypothetical protein